MRAVHRPVTASERKTTPRRTPSGSRGKRACKPGSVEDDHLSWTRVTARLEHATRMHGRAAVSHSYLRLLQMGFSKPRRCRRAGALLPHRFSFSPDRAAAGESSFLWHFPSGRPAQPLAGILPLGARTFLTPKRAIAWPACGRYCSTSLQLSRKYHEEARVPWQACALARTVHRRGC